MTYVKTDRTADEWQPAPSVPTITVWPPSETKRPIGFWPWPEEKPKRKPRPRKPKAST